MMRIRMSGGVGGVALVRFRPGPGLKLGQLGDAGLGDPGGELANRAVLRVEPALDGLGHRDKLGVGGERLRRIGRGRLPGFLVGHRVETVGISPTGRIRGRREVHPGLAVRRVAGAIAAEFRAGVLPGGRGPDASLQVAALDVVTGHEVAARAGHDQWNGHRGVLVSKAGHGSHHHMLVFPALGPQYLRRES